MRYLLTMGWGWRASYFKVSRTTDGRGERTTDNFWFHELWWHCQVELMNEWRKEGRKEERKEGRRKEGKEGGRRKERKQEGKKGRKEDGSKEGKKERPQERKEGGKERRKGGRKSTLIALFLIFLIPLVIRMEPCWHLDTETCNYIREIHVFFRVISVGIKVFYAQVVHSFFHPRLIPGPHTRGSRCGCGFNAVPDQLQ